MLRADRKYDLILYGASGFTGRQAVGYCKQFAPQGLRWAIAGRSRSKLEQVNSAGVEVFVAEAQDADALNRLAAQTCAVASTAGPFSLYGTKLVDACVNNRTHYCDITGETPWIRGLIERHHARAAADGTRIIPCCGFDSIPSDYGAWLTSRHIREVLQSDCTRISAAYRIHSGSFSARSHPVNPYGGRTSSQCRPHWGSLRFGSECMDERVSDGIDQHPGGAPNSGSTRRHL
jgi:short subunit dehydrogenase-like uncharacterized protein